MIAELKHPGMVSCWMTSRISELDDSLLWFGQKTIQNKKRRAPRHTRDCFFRCSVQAAVLCEQIDTNHRKHPFFAVRTFDTVSCSDVKGSSTVTSLMAGWPLLSPNRAVAPSAKNSATKSAATAALLAGFALMLLLYFLACLLLRAGAVSGSCFVCVSCPLVCVYGTARESSARIRNQRKPQSVSPSTKNKDCWSSRSKNAIGAGYSIF